MVSKVDLVDSETDPTGDSELTKEEDSNVASMGSATIAVNMGTRQITVNLNQQIVPLEEKWR